MTGGAWTLCGQSLLTLCSLVCMPFLIRGLGIEAYGLIVLVNVLTGYIGFADLGMGTASTKFASESYALQDVEKEAAIIWTALLVSAVPSIIVALALVASAGWLVERGLHLPDSLRGQAVHCLRLTAFIFLARSAAGVLNTPQLVRLRMDLFTMINSGSGIAQAILATLVVALGGGLVGAVGVMAIAALAALLAHGVISHLLLPQLFRLQIRPDLIIPLLKFGVAILAMTFFGVILAQGEKVILTRFVSVRALAYYSVASTLAGLLTIIPSALNSSFLPAASRMWANSEREEIGLLHSRVLRINLMWVLPAAIVLCAFARPFFSLWAGPEFGRESSLPCYILVAGFVVNTMAYAPGTLLMAAGRADVPAKCYAAEFVPFCLCTAALSSRFEAAGAAFAWSLRTIVDALVLVWAMRRITGLSFSPLPDNRLGYAAALALLTLPLAAARASEASLILQIAVIPISLAAYGILIWTRVLANEERAWLRHVVQGGCTKLAVYLGRVYVPS